MQSALPRQQASHVSMHLHLLRSTQVLFYRCRRRRRRRRLRHSRRHLLGGHHAHFPLHFHFKVFYFSP